MKNLDPRLILNYDQIWRLRFRGPQKLKYKRRLEAGQTKDPLHAKRAKQKIANDVQTKRLQSEGTLISEEQMVPRNQKRKRDTTNGDMDDAEVVRPLVKRNRMAYTVVTSIWGDGTPGPIAIHFSQDAGITHAVMQELNTQFRGRMWVCSSNSDTHFMNAESTIRYLKFPLTYAVQMLSISFNIRSTVAIYFIDVLLIFY